MKVYEGTAFGAPVKVRKAAEHDGGTGYEYELRHYVRHSPDGFAWGYGGSGPAELARCILIDHLGLDAEAEKDPELVLPVGYQSFKFDVIAGLPQREPWRLTSEEIEEWSERVRGRTA